MINQGLIDVSNTEGQWEAYTTQLVTNPAPGIDQALVIAGADKRGSIYGLYDISEQIGVSPWYFWADVPAVSQEAIYAMNTDQTTRLSSCQISRLLHERRATSTHRLG